jgi:type VI secretion system secreted protein Hcp
MAVPDIYLKIEGIEGEAQDQAHAKEIEILSFSFGVSNMGSGDVGLGSGSSRSSLSDLSIMKHVDKASPGLFLGCCVGTSYPTATLTIRKAGGDDPVEYLKYDMAEVFISSVQTAGSDGGGIATESVSLNFSKMHVFYTPQKAEGGPDASIDKWYNVKTHDKG